MARGLRQAADSFQQIFSLDGSRLLHRSPFGQLGDRRTTSHGWNTPLRPETDVRNASALQSKCQFQDISADGILDPGPCVGVGNFPGIARILKMIEKFAGIHAIIVTAHRS